MQIDFSALSDDQLVHLIRSACQEAATRGDACAAAAKDAILDEAEKARIAREASEATAAKLRAEEEARVRAEAEAKVRAQAALKTTDDETKKQERRWALRKGMAQAVERVISDLCKFGVTSKSNRMLVELWQKGADRRIFLGYGFDKGVVAYYVTGGGGSRPKPPKFLENVRGDADVKKHHTKIVELCEAIAKLYPGATAKIDVREALDWPGEAIPLANFIMPDLPKSEPSAETGATS